MQRHDIRDVSGCADPGGHGDPQLGRPRRHGELIPFLIPYSCSARLMMITENGQIRPRSGEAVRPLPRCREQLHLCCDGLHRFPCVGVGVRCVAIRRIHVLGIGCLGVLRLRRGTPHRIWNCRCRPCEHTDHVAHAQAESPHRRDCGRAHRRARRARSARHGCVLAPAMAAACRHVLAHARNGRGRPAADERALYDARGLADAAAATATVRPSKSGDIPAGQPVSCAVTRDEWVRTKSARVHRCTRGIMSNDDNCRSNTIESFHIALFIGRPVLTQVFVHLGFVAKYIQGIAKENLRLCERRLPHAIASGTPVYSPGRVLYDVCKSRCGCAPDAP
jgi:hypothetical protein